MNTAIIVGLIALIVFLMIKSGWLKDHKPHRRIMADKPDFQMIEQRLQEIALVRGHRSY